eukprot:TRINITY_DN27388_c0_g1_i2.p1 TRINITY_DN27388_c0_g1~~TRINITY_DN27388_c0_g1_i2.p1  ORF type:complete len:171 (-),score=34.39 TRINITY_DN27388_c0_g1_i2:423-935(-)
MDYLKGNIEKYDLLLDGKSKTEAEDIEDAFAFVCAHKLRDDRCGYCGPALVSEANSLKDKGSVPKSMKVRACSHVGGHVYAGNVIMFSGRDGSQEDGQWYGYVTRENLKDVLTGRGLRRSLWRGRMGISEQACKQERKMQKFKDVATILGIASVIGLAVYAIAGRRKEKQ